MLPLSSVFASANQNEKTPLPLLGKAKMILERCKPKVRSEVTDSQYSDSKLRSAVEKTIISDRSSVSDIANSIFLRSYFPFFCLDFLAYQPIDFRLQKREMCFSSIQLQGR
jgi:hypothetical protein